MKPADGSVPELLQSETFAVAYQSGIPGHVIDIIKGVIVEIIGDLLTGGTNEQETWGEGNNSFNSLDERNLGQFWYDINTGRSALTDYADVPMESIASGWWQSSYLSAAGLNIFVAQDSDSNGKVDHVYMQDEDGNWWVATSTTDGNPNWQPSDPPKRPDEDGDKTSEVEG